MPTHPTGLKNTWQNLPSMRLSKFRLPTTEHYSTQGRLSVRIQKASVMDERIVPLATVERERHLFGKPTLRPSDEKRVCGYLSSDYFPDCPSYRHHASRQCFVRLSHGLKHRRGPYRCDRWDQRRMAARGRYSSCQRRLADRAWVEGACRRWDVDSIGPYRRCAEGAQGTRSDAI